MEQWIYPFGGRESTGSLLLINLLGSKGAHLAEMARLNLPVPPGFTITTDVCQYYYQHNKTVPDTLSRQVYTALQQMEHQLGRTFGDAKNPLLVSVRSGSPVSMPGMLDTVLNLGLNDHTAAALAARSNNRRFAYDSYRRFIQMYGHIVLNLDPYLFEDMLQWHKDQHDYRFDAELTAEDCWQLSEQFKAKVLEETGEPFPQDVHVQLDNAILGVLDSWQNPRAIRYRQIHQIPAHIGTAVTIQAMVFGNMGMDSATGVAFTRHPSTGQKILFGEYLINAQGEDVVSGNRTPQSIADGEHTIDAFGYKAMQEQLPEAFATLAEICGQLEQHLQDMQDIEFTVETGKVWLLQTRPGKRSGSAALKIAVDMVAEGLITERQALQRIEPSSIEQLLHPLLDSDAPKQLLTRGLPAAPGAISGIIALDSESAKVRAADGSAVILLRNETNPDDIQGMQVAKGVLTCRGGMTSHAAVVARGMGRPCVVGAQAIQIDLHHKTFTINGQKFFAGDRMTLDGSTGEVFAGVVPTVQPHISGDLEILLGWADKVRRLKVYANAETPEEVDLALKLHAEGIGLCRTEHLFFNPARLNHLQQVLTATTLAERQVVLTDLLPIQIEDFKKLFTRMQHRPLLIRLLDPPLHEFLPSNHFRRETNPMLGFRGARLGVTCPEIYQMQVRAIFTAWQTVKQALPDLADISIMLPMITTVQEFTILKQHIAAVASSMQALPTYRLGAMIEVPRAAIQASELADVADFFSFGSNDLTQTVCGLSRDDTSHYWQPYLQQGIFAADPFVTLDINGVGALMRYATDQGRLQHPDFVIGICGEHGGDPASIAFCHGIGLDYVSCSPYRVPVARLAAAKAALADRS